MSDDKQAPKPLILDSFLQMFDHIGMQSKLLAKKLDKERSIYYGYAVCDSISSSSSMFNYACNFLLPNINSDAMHDLMMTPTVIIIITAESLFLIGFSVLAAKYDKEKEESYKKWIADAWPYFRDVMKALKNGSKGANSALTAISLLSNTDLKYMITPIGLIFGVFAAANRFWLRDMVELRKGMMDSNGDLLKEIQNLLSLTHEESRDYFKDIQEQSHETRINAYLAVTAGAFIDGLYLYVGVLGLAALSISMLSVMAVLCSVYTLACVVTRLYEEYDFQQRLIMTQTRCKLEIVARELETSYLKLLTLHSKTDKNNEYYFELALLKKDVSRGLNDFELYRNLLSQQSNHSLTTSCLLGIKNGLYAYGALASILFFAGSMCTMAGIPFPPALILTSSIAGLVFMMSFTIYSIQTNYIPNNQKQAETKRPYNHLSHMKDTLNLKTVELLKADSFRISMMDGLIINSSKKDYFQEWFEVFRSFSSGLFKGLKFIGFAGNFLKDCDERGHYHDSNIMIVLELFSALLFGTIFALRALARGLGRVPLGEREKSSTSSDYNAEYPPETPAINQKCPPNTVVCAPAEVIKSAILHKSMSQNKVFGTSVHSIKTRKDFPKKSDSLSTHGFFENKIKNRIPHAESNESLITLNLASKHTIRGLT